AVIAHILLDFVARTEADGQARLHLPIILNEQSSVELFHVLQWSPARDDVLSRRAGLVGGERIEDVLSREIRRVIARLRSFPQPRPELNELCTVGDRSVVLQLVVVLVRVLEREIA